MEKPNDLSFDSIVQKSLQIKLLYLICYIIVLEQLRDMKIILSHIQYLLINDAKVLSCILFRTKNYRVLSLYASCRHHQTQIITMEF